MKRFQFLLLDAGPIIKLFELGLWDTFIKKYEVSISRTVANEAKYVSLETEDIRIDLEPYADKSLINIFELKLSDVSDFYEKFNHQYKSIIHPGEKETLAFLEKSSCDWLLCSADSSVFRVLGLLGKSEQGISLEEVLEKIGCSKRLEWQYKKAFREKYTQDGQRDSIQDKGLS